MTKIDFKKNLIEYFKKNLMKGYTSKTLKWALINQGYSSYVIGAALEKAQKEMAEKAPILKEKPKIKYEILDENNNPITIRKPWWKRIFGM